MAHRTLKPGYSGLMDRLNRFPQGAPPSELLNKILKMLFSEKEAGLVSLLPIKPFSAKKAAEIPSSNRSSTASTRNDPRVGSIPSDSVWSTNVRSGVAL